MIQIECLANQLLKNDWVIDSKIYNLSKLNWDFKFNNRKKSLGMCDGSVKTIYLSKDLVISNLNNICLWEDTIRHEIAHAIDFEIRNYTDHSDIWKNIGKQVGCETECFNDDLLIKPLSKYTLKCDTCGSSSNAHRRKTLKPACSSCCVEHNNGKYSTKFILRTIVNY